jgi:TrpR-related protein YerC/YecD
MLNQRETNFYRAVLTLRDEEECLKFFRDILSPSELETLVNRWSILLLLHQGFTQREIAKRLGVGVYTVSRANQVYQRDESILRLIMQRLGS